MPSMKERLIKWLAVLNSIEGVMHLVFAGIGFWGCVVTGVWDWRVVAPCLENMVLGMFSLFTGIVLGKHHHH